MAAWRCISAETSSGGVRRTASRSGDSLRFASDDEATDEGGERFLWLNPGRTVEVELLELADLILERERGAKVCSGREVGRG